MHNQTESNKMKKNGGAGEKADAAGWAVLFIWLGIVSIANISGAISLIGIGSIILAVQVVRGILDRKWELFQAAIGFLFVMGGIWKLMNIKLELIPVLCIAAGVAGLVILIAPKFLHNEPLGIDPGGSHE